MRSLFFFLLLLLAASLNSEAYVLEGQQWPNGNIVMNLQLSTTTYPLPTGGLADGTPNWNIVCENALADWNQYLLNVTFTFNLNAVTPSAPDHINSVFFSSTVYGQSFGSGTLGITVRYFNGTTNRTTESDTVINTAFQWDSYRGPLRPNAQDTAYIFDIRRVFDHELGHNLGLNHPDLATPPQTVTAIMNSVTSDLDHIELDDISGVWSMYGQKSPSVPVFVTAAPSGGGSVTGANYLPVNTVQTLTATPATGYTFVSWEDGSTNSTRSITVPVGGATYTATFQLTFEDWTTISSASTINDLIFAKNQFYAFANSTTYTSTDGTTWTAHASTLSSSPFPGSVAYGNGVFVYSGGTVYTSTDGFTWTSGATLPNGEGLVSYGNGIFLVPGIAINGVATSMYTSNDGVHWTTHAGPQGYAANAITYGNGHFVSEGYQDNVGDISAVTVDGTAWSTGTFPNDNVRSITYGRGNFVAAGVGHLLQSTDGLHWQADVFPGSTSYVGDVTNVSYGSGFFIADSSYETIFSTDGVNWTLQPSTVSDNFPLVFGNGLFVGYGSSFVRSGAVLPQAGAPSLPVINSALALQSLPGTALSYSITATNSPTVYNAVGLPTGLSINLQTGAISGTPAGTGTFPITLFATNDAGSGTATLNLIVAPAATPETFSAWATAHNVTGGMSASPRNDGIPNLLKYLYDIDPTVPLTASARASLPLVATASSGSQLTLTFPENKILENVGVAVQTSTDLVTWSTPSGSSITATGAINGNGDPIMVAQVPVTASNQFIRLVVTPQ